MAKVSHMPVRAACDIGSIKRGTWGVLRNIRRRLGNGRFAEIKVHVNKKTGKVEYEQGPEYITPIDVEFKGCRVLIPCELHEVGLEEPPTRVKRGEKATSFSRVVPFQGDIRIKKSTARQVGSHIAMERVLGPELLEIRRKILSAKKAA